MPHWTALNNKPLWSPEIFWDLFALPLLSRTSQSIETGKLLNQGAHLRRLAWEWFESPMNENNCNIKVVDDN
jgi:hypothetical protein